MSFFFMVIQAFSQVCFGEQLFTYSILTLLYSWVSILLKHPQKCIPANLKPQIKGFNLKKVNQSLPPSTGILNSDSHQIYGDNGTITSPNFTRLYPDKLSILWNITAVTGNQIKLHFTSFHLKLSKSCDTDFVQVNDGPLPFSDAIVRMCGKRRSDKIVFSTGPHLQIYFNTDVGNSYHGFRVSYEAVGEYLSQKISRHKAFSVFRYGREKNRRVGNGFLS